MHWVLRLLFLEVKWPWNEDGYLCQLEKKLGMNVIRIITNSRMSDSCMELFKKLEILPIYSQYIFLISIFMIKNQHLFCTNNHIHSIHTRFKTNLHPLHFISFHLFRVR